MSKKIVSKGNDVISIDGRYKSLLTEIKDKIRSSRLKAALAINYELINLYWYIGKRTIEKEAETTWGGKLIETLSHDLQNAFPETTGFSKRNIERMRQFAREYPNLQIAAQVVPQLPWGHIVTLIQKIKDLNMRDWYASQSIINGWSRTTLELYIKRNLFGSQAVPQNKASNFMKRLSDPQSRITQELLKSPYNFDFLGLHEEAHEREVEHTSIKHITKFMVELGKGFAFVGNQVLIELSEKEYFIDMLFYHLKLHAYCVIELKKGDFKPEYAGKLNFYLSLVDDYYKAPQDNPSFGILLCKSRNKFEAEYVLKSIEKPIGVSEYEITRAIPDNLKTNLPTVKEIESELNEAEKIDIETKKIKK